MNHSIAILIILQSDDQRSSADRVNSYHGHPQYHLHSERAQQYQRLDYEYHWQAVPRSWEAVDPRTSRATQDPALDQRLIALSPGSRDSRSHTHVSRHSESSQTHDSTPGPSGPQLTASRLKNFDSRQPSTTNMDRWMGASQRDGAWDGVGYVRMREDDYRRSDGLR